MLEVNDKEMVAFANQAVASQLRAWAAPSPGSIDYEADEFKQQAAVDLWLAFQGRPTLSRHAMKSVVRRSMAGLLRRRLGRNGERSMRRMSTDQLDQFPAPASDYPVVLYDALDYISSKLSNGSAVIIDCLKGGANVTDIIQAMQISVSSFYIRLNRIRRAMEVVWEN